MTPGQIRRTNLLTLIQKRFGGNKGAFADTVETKRPQIYRYFSDLESAQEPGEVFSRAVEVKLGLPRLALDQLPENFAKMIENMNFLIDREARIKGGSRPISAEISLSWSDPGASPEGDAVSIAGIDLVQGLATVLTRRMKDSGGKWTAESLGAASKIGKSTVNRACNGQGAIGIDTLEALAKAFKIPPSALIREAENGISEPKTDPLAPTINDVNQLSDAHKQFLTTVRTILGQIPADAIRAINSLMWSYVPPVSDENGQTASVKRR